jgi:HAD superfamily hydrolase (TIGR01458 family)
MEALLLDLDGVFYVGEKGIPGGDAAAAWVIDADIPHRYVTNTTSRPRAALVNKLRGFNIEVNEEAILTPPVAAAAWLKRRRLRRLAAYVPAATLDEFHEFELADRNADDAVDAIVVGDLGEQWDFATLNHAFRRLMTQPQPVLVALGMTRFWRAPDGLRLDTAPFVKALSHASGVEPTVLGKPARAFFQTALDMLNVSADRAVMVGDDLDADIGGAQGAGLQGVLVRTGKHRSDRSERVQPDAILDSIADLPDWWNSRGRPGR